MAHLLVIAAVLGTANAAAMFFGRKLARYRGRLSEDAESGLFFSQQQQA